MSWPLHSARGVGAEVTDDDRERIGAGDQEEALVEEDRLFAALRLLKRANPHQVAAGTLDRRTTLADQIDVDPVSRGKRAAIALKRERSVFEGQAQMKEGRIASPRQQGDIADKRNRTDARQPAEPLVHGGEVEQLGEGLIGSRSRRTTRSNPTTSASNDQKCQRPPMRSGSSEVARHVAALRQSWERHHRSLAGVRHVV